MNTTLANNELGLVGLLFLEISAGALLAYGFQRLTRSARMRRLAWQSFFVASALIVAGEVTGFNSRFVAVLRPGQISMPVIEAEKPDPGWAKLREAVRTRTDSTAASRPVEPRAAVSGSLPAPAAKPDRAFWIGPVWVMGALLIGFLAVGMRAWLRLRLRNRQAVAAVELNAQLLPDDIRGKIRILQSKRITSPYAFGVFRPTIVLPQSFSHYREEQQQVILFHEIAHLKQHDPLWLLLCDLVGALIWWHPAIWFARRQFRIQAEAVADEASLALANGPELLAECLVQLGRVSLDRGSWVGFGMGSFRSGLGRRVERLLSIKPHQNVTPGAWAQRLGLLLFPIALVTVLLAGTAWSDQRQNLKGDPHMNSFKAYWSKSVVGAALVSFLAAPEAPAQRKPAAPPVAATPSASALPVVAAEKKPGAAPAVPVAPAVKPGGAATGIVAKSAGRPLSTTANPREEVRRKLEEWKIESVKLPEEIELREFIKVVAEEARKADPTASGINFLFANDKYDPNAQAAQNPYLGLGGVGGIGGFGGGGGGVGGGAGGAAAAPFVGQLVADASIEIESVIIRLPSSLKDIRFIDLLNIMKKASRFPIQYSIEDYGVLISFDKRGLSADSVKTFQIESQTLLNNLESTFGIRQPQALTHAAYQRIFKDMFSTLGAEQVKTYFYNDATGLLLVRAPQDELDLIAAAIDTLGGHSAQAANAPGLR